MSQQRKTILEVQGMTCASCVRHVTAALEEVGGVDGIEVKMRDGLVVVQHDEAATSIDRLVEALLDAGYASQPRPV